jgi:hypothetical protein
MFLLALAGIGAAALLVMMVVTRWGIGLSPDSATYIAGARSLPQGHGISFPLGGGRWQPITSWAPFYSIVLAVPAMAGLDPWIAARWFNAALLGANAILIALLMRRMLGGGQVLPILAAILFLVSSESLAAHGWAWSDPLFVFLGFLGLLLLDSYLQDGRRANLIAAGVLVGLCAYTRYIGMAFIIVGLAALALGASRSAALKARGFDLAVFATLGCLPAAAWSLRNLGLVGSLGGDIVRTRGIPAGDWLAVYRAISHWFIPGRVPEPARDGLMLGLLGVFAMLSVLAVGGNGRRSAPGSLRLARMILLFVFVYAAVLIGSRLSLRAFNFRDVRYYLPVYMSLSLLWLFDLSWLHAKLTASFSRVKDARRTRIGTLTMRAVWAGAFVAIVSLHAVEAAKWARESYSEGLGYANVSWHHSGILEYIRGVPDETPIVSNAFDAIYVLTGRETYPFPRGSGEAAIPTGLTRAEEWRQTIDLMEEGGALLADFRDATRRGQVGAAEIADETSICPIRIYPEGEMYSGCERETGELLPGAGSLESAG